MEVSRIIHYIDGEDMHWKVYYTSSKPIDIPYLAGKFQPLMPGFDKMEEVEVDHSLFNESKLGRIDVPMGKNELCYLTLQPETMLSQIYTEPDSLATDILISADYDCFIYSFYNNTDSPNISIIAKLVEMDKKLFTKLKSNLTDIAFRQYILKKMLGKYINKELLAPSQVTGKENLTIKEVAEYLNKKVGTIYNWVYKNQIPFHKTGGSLLFKKSEIDKWVSARK